MKEGLFIIGDFCGSYKEDIKPLLDKDLINEMFYKIENDKIESKDKITMDNLEIARKNIEEVILNY